jgi:hypothetical protein
MPKQGRKPYRQDEVKLQDILYVDNEGILKWKVRWGKMKPGQDAGRLYGDNQFMVKIRGKFCLVRDIVMLLSNSHSISGPVAPDLNVSEDEVSNNN